MLAKFKKSEMLNEGYLSHPIENPIAQSSCEGGVALDVIPLSCGVTNSNFFLLQNVHLRNLSWM